MISESELWVAAINLWTTSRGYSEIHGHKSPVIHTFLQETGAGRSLYIVGSEVRDSRMTFLKVLDSGESTLNVGLLPSLLPSSQVGRVQRSLPGPSLGVGSDSMS